MTAKRCEQIRSESDTLEKRVLMHMYARILGYLSSKAMGELSTFSQSILYNKHRLGSKSPIYPHRKPFFTERGLESPRLLSLTFTHILQIDFVKRPEERIVIADYFTVSTVLIRFTGGPKKMWVRISI
jgi:hypothetical protein